MCSHELKTPMTVLLANADLLAMTSDRMDIEARNRSLRSLGAQTKKLNRLVCDLLDFTRLRTGHLTIRPAALNLREFIISVVGSFRQGCDTHRVIFDLGMLDSETVHADPGRLEQVLMNILSNASRYSPPGSQILLEVSCDEDVAHIAISDQGSGIAEADIPRLFDRYYQAPEARAKMAGLGLGLYISHEIVRLHGGTIEVESAVGRGSTFVVTIPVTHHVEQPGPLRVSETLGLALTSDMA